MKHIQEGYSQLLKKGKKGQSGRRMVEMLDECEQTKQQVGIGAQSGRSMVEMLGVLAIIGVLSVGGIVGYRYAMERKIANDVLVLMEKFLLGYLEESRNPNSILYTSTRTTAASNTGAIPGTTDFTYYFDDFYGIDSECVVLHSNFDFCFSNGFAWGVNPYKTSNEWWLELFLAVPQSVCEVVLTRVIQDEEFAPLTRVFFGVSLGYASYLSLDSVSSYCGRLSKINSAFKRDYVGIGLNLVFPIE